LRAGLPGDPGLKKKPGIDLKKNGIRFTQKIFDLILIQKPLFNPKFFLSGHNCELK